MEHISPQTMVMALLISQDVHSDIILWYVEKIVPILQEFSLFLSSISSNYFDGDINSVHALERGIKYCKIHL